MGITITNTYGTPHHVSEDHPAHVTSCDYYRLPLVATITPTTPGYEDMVDMLKENGHNTREGYGLIFLESEEFSATYFGSRFARSIRIPLATSTRFTPFTARAFRNRSIVGLWLVPRSLQIVGWTHESRRHFASTSGRVQRIRYMLAVGPPRSLIVPLKPGSRAIPSTSFRTEASERLWITRPSCIVMLQKVHPPKQPRMMVTESLIMPWAGIGSV